MSDDSSYEDIGEVVQHQISADQSSTRKIRSTFQELYARHPILVTAAMAAAASLAVYVISRWQTRGLRSRIAAVEEKQNALQQWASAMIDTIAGTRRDNDHAPGRIGAPRVSPIPTHHSDFDKPPVAYAGELPMPPTTRFSDTISMDASSATLELIRKRMAQLPDPYYNC